MNLWKSKNVSHFSFFSHESEMKNVGNVGGVKALATPTPNKLLVLLKDAFSESRASKENRLFISLKAIHMR
jgi:hypothetical protein